MRTPLIMLALLGSLQAANLKVISDLESEHIRYRSLIGSITEEQFESVALELLQPRRITLGKVAIYGSQEDRVLSGPRGFDHCAYNHWRSVVTNPKPGCPVVREALKVGSGIVVRSVDHECRRTTKVLRGKDPLTLDAAGQKFELLDISFSRPMGDENRHRLRAGLYVRTDGALSATVARSLTARVIDLTGVTEISVELRADSWFITDCGFPARFAFEGQKQIPTAEEFAKTKYASCGSFQFTHGRIQCFDGTSHP
jgi:hypothetical protein